MTYKAIIFDLDGVICFTDHFHYLAWKELADEIGVQFDEITNNRLRGVSRMASLEIILEKYPKSLNNEEKHIMANKKNELYRSLLKNMSVADLSEEVKHTLDQLRQKGLKIAIGSSSKNASTILSRIGLGSYFDAISDGNNITRSKPDPQVFIMAAQMLNMDPSECLVVEDAKAGIEAAIAGDFDSAAIGDAVGCALATYNLDSIPDLLKYV